MDAWWLPALRGVFAGRDVIIAGGVPASWKGHVDHLRTAGAQRILIVAPEGRGVGRGPDVPTVVVEPPPDLGLMERVRFGNRTLRHPPPDVVDALASFDPRREAIVVGSFLNEAAELDGRPFLAHRRHEWVALEDKTVVDALCDRAGVERLPSVVVPLAAAAAAAESLDRGTGTVWAADARDGFHGGAQGTRWVADTASRERALADLLAMCDRVRVMPFVDGIPCSVHGIVLPDGVAVLRPVEMVTLRRGHDLVYTGCATFWDPPHWARHSMRDAARRIGRLLAAEVGFRGTFTLDGVVDADGFWPTELNPRFGAGINVIANATDDVPILLIHDLAVAGRDVGAMASVVETSFVDHADAHRAGGTWTATSAGTATADARPVAFDGVDWRWCRGSDDASVGTAVAGPSFARCLFEPGATPVGPSVGPRAAAWWRFADRELHTGLGALSPAPDPFR